MKVNKMMKRLLCIQDGPGQNFNRELDTLLENFTGFPSHSNNARVIF